MFGSLVGELQLVWILGLIATGSLDPWFECYSVFGSLAGVLQHGRILGWSATARLDRWWYC